jgi:hypothetical protein
MSVCCCNAWFRMQIAQFAFKVSRMLIEGVIVARVAYNYVRFITHFGGLRVAAAEGGLASLYSSGTLWRGLSVMYIFITKRLIQPCPPGICIMYQFTRHYF